MIFIIAITLYLGFVGFVIWKENVCSDGAVVLFLGLIVIAVSAGLVTHVSTPEDPNNWRAVCLKNGGSLVHAVYEVGSNHVLEEECKK